MLGFGPLGSAPLGGLPAEIMGGSNKAVLRISSLIVPDKPVDEGLLIKSTSHVWAEIVRRLGKDWSVAHEISPGQWEEIVAGAFKKAGYDDVVLTPRSGDHGR